MRTIDVCIELCSQHRLVKYEQLNERVRTTKKSGAVTAKKIESTLQTGSSAAAVIGGGTNDADQLLQDNKNNFIPRTSRIIMKSFPAGKALCHEVYENEQLETISNR